MIRSLRRVFVWGCQHGFTILAVFLVVGYSLSLLKPGPAQADEAVDILKSVALSDVAMEDKLCALEELKEKGSSAARAALVEIAEKAELRVAMAACAQLGRVKSSDSKGDLKGLLEDGGNRIEVRLAAATGIATHWKDSGDISYLEGKCSGNTKLSAHLTEVKSRVYGK